MQITAEQIVREAKEHQEEDFKPPTQKIADVEELAEYRLQKRKEFEDLIRRVYWNESVWVKYAKWEESQKDFARARSVWERALDHHHRSHSLWLKYAEMEMSNKFVNHARNVWDRAVTLLPRVDQFWYKYVHMEEMMGQIANARAIFERWMRWEPDHNGWNAYIRMETRYKEWSRVRAIYERYCECHPSVKAWVRWAKFEMSLSEVARAREVYEHAAESMAYEVDADQLYAKFAEFEIMAGEHERARGIYKYALDNLPKDKARGVYQSFMLFEKQHGDREAIEDVVLGKRRVQYEADVRANPTNYDVWFDYEIGGVQRRRGEDAGGVRARHRVRASREREEVLAAVHLPVDQLRAVRGAGGAGRGAHSGGVQGVPQTGAAQDFLLQQDLDHGGDVRDSAETPGRRAKDPGHGHRARAQG